MNYFTGNAHNKYEMSSACCPFTSSFFNKKGMVIIMDCNANKSIGCTVHQCQYHCGSENYCTLSKINVGTHESQPSDCQCTDCESFKAKNC